MTDSPSTDLALADLDKPMDEIERVRLALAMTDAGYEWDVSIEDVIELLARYDALRPASSDPDAVRALEGMVELYCDLVNSGDAGFWDPEKIEQVIAARAALAHRRTPAESDRQDTRTDAEIKAYNLHAALQALLGEYENLLNKTNSEPLVESETDPNRVAGRALYDNRPLADWEPPALTSQRPPNSSKEGGK